MDRQWRKSSYSGVRNECVEARVSDTETSAQLRDTRHRDHGPLTFPHHEWAAFVAELPSL
ncbi:DUF397 domain-containing protein [Streptomonospora wellingtoniae]|uniref:DUF397 domain-containing protein n=1 Tax=Streptomonospora wellingtoniae TaxID=3075544 RepID=A0ABU2KU00_9ACTN|nr:DUF397 domain-containing protein [Streptomonospora sp. DSM 45055]MDT0302774.1 DUF397 domain-containing protein [Streptomonospora sp. DSM 45055]